MMTGFRRASLLAAVMTLMGVGAGLAVETQAAGECTLTRVETEPQAVIEPCTRIIADTAASAAERGNALFVRGKFYHNTKRFEQAGRDYDAALELMPANAELLASRANIAFRGHRYDEGVAFVEQALRVDPSNAHALRIVGTVYEDSGDAEQAYRYYSLALESDPHDPWALWFRSQNRRWERRFDAALKDADALVAMPPAEINRQGYFDRWGDRHDFHIMALENRARIYDEMRQPERAEQDLDAAIAYGRTYLSLGTRGKFLAYWQGREAEALSDLSEAIALGSVDEEVFYAIGMMQVKHRQFEEALGSFNRAFEIAPRFADALRMRARMHRELDQTELAVSDMMQAVTLSARVLRESMPALRAAGYWPSGEMPDTSDPALADAIRACMLDEHCN